VIRSIWQRSDFSRPSFPRNLQPTISQKEKLKTRPDAVSRRLALEKSAGDALADSTTGESSFNMTYLSGSGQKCRFKAAISRAVGSFFLSCSK